MARYNKNRYGSIVLQDVNGENFTITKKEQAQLKTLVKRANQRTYDKVNRYYNMIKDQGNMKGISKEVYKDLLERKGFITEKYSSAFKQFNSKKEFKEYIKELKGVTKKGYGNDRIEKIQQTMIDRVFQNYGEDGKDLAKMIKDLSHGQLLSIYLHNDEIVKTIYDSDSKTNIEELVNKTMSDINVALKKSKKRG